VRNYKIILGLLAALLLPVAASANSSARGWCEIGAQTVTTSGLTSTTQVQASYPGCSITVIIHGGGAVTIYSDNSNTPLSNPFTSTLSGQWTFFAANGRYDITLSGGGLPSPVVYSDVVLFDAASVGGVLTSTGSPVANQVTYFTSASQVTGTPTDTTPTHALFTTAGAPAFRQPTLTDIAGGTAPAGTYNFSGVTLIQLRAGATLTTSTNGDIGYDTTNKNWHGFANGVDSLFATIPTSVGVANEDCTDWDNVAGTISLADFGSPCVSLSLPNTWTGSQTFSGAMNANGGGALNGTFSGPTTLSGTYSTTNTGTHTGLETAKQLNNVVAVDGTGITTIQACVTAAAAITGGPGKCFVPTNTPGPTSQVEMASGVTLEFAPGTFVNATTTGGIFINFGSAVSNAVVRGQGVGSTTLQNTGSTVTQYGAVIQDEGTNNTYEAMTLDGNNNTSDTLLIRTATSPHFHNLKVLQNISVAVVNVVGNGVTATVTCSTNCFPPNGFASGKAIRINGNTQAAFNGTFTTNGAGTTTFTFASATNATGTGGFVAATFLNSAVSIEGGSNAEAANIESVGGINDSFTLGTEEFGINWGNISGGVYENIFAHDGPANCMSINAQGAITPNSTVKGVTFHGLKTLNCGKVGTFTGTDDGSGILALANITAADNTSMSNIVIDDFTSQGNGGPGLRIKGNVSGSTFVGSVSGNGTQTSQTNRDGVVVLIGVNNNPKSNQVLISGDKGSGTNILSSNGATSGNQYLVASNDPVSMAATSLDTAIQTTQNGTQSFILPANAASIFKFLGGGTNLFQINETGGYYLGESAAVGGAGGFSSIWADNTAHKLKANNNNAGAVTFGYIDLAETISGVKSFNSGTILPSAAGGTDLGSTALPFGNLWLGTAATNNFKFQPASTTGARIITIADPLSPTTVAMPLTIASGTKALNTASITTATCDAGAAVAATGVLSTDTVDWSFNAAPTATNKYGAFLVVYAVPSAGNVTFYTCNPSATTSTPTAMSINWSVRR